MMEQMVNPDTHSRSRKWVWSVAIIILSAIPFFRSYGLRNHPMREDEYYWVGQAYYFHLAFEKWDWTNSDWQLLPARENPVLGKYVIGLGLRLGGLSVTNIDWLGIFYFIAKDRPNAWGNVHDQKERLAVLNRMDPATRSQALEQGKFKASFAYATTGRLVMLFFGIISVLAVFVLASLYTNAVVAFLAALVFSLHPAVVAAYTEVGVDILAITFSLLAVICFVLVERNVWQRSRHPNFYRILICAMGGFSLAFAVGSKMNAAIVGLAGGGICLWFAVSWLRCRRNDLKNSLMTMIWLLVISLVVFVAPNPGNYPNPARGIWSLYADQERSLEVQKTIPTIQKPLYSWSKKIEAVADLTAFHAVIFALVAAAFLFLVVDARKSGRSIVVIAFWWLTATVAVIVWIPFHRERYVVPVVAPSLIVLFCALERLYQIGWSGWLHSGKYPKIGHQ